MAPGVGTTAASRFSLLLANAHPWPALVATCIAQLSQHVTPAALPPTHLLTAQVVLFSLLPQLVDVLVACSYMALKLQPWTAVVVGCTGAARTGCRPVWRCGESTPWLLSLRPKGRRYGTACGVRPHQRVKCEV